DTGCVLTETAVYDESCGQGQEEDGILMKPPLVLFGDRAQIGVDGTSSRVRDLDDHHMLAHQVAARIEPLSVRFENRQSVFEAWRHDVAHERFPLFIGDATAARNVRAEEEAIDDDIRLRRDVIAAARRRQQQRENECRMQNAEGRNALPFSAFCILLSAFIQYSHSVTAPDRSSCAPRRYAQHM